MSSISLPFMFKLASRDTTIEHDLLINVSPGFQHLRFGQKLPSRSVPLAYVQLDQLAGSNNLLINNNYIVSSENETKVNGKSFISPTKDILLTDVFVRNVKGGLTPLYYGHKLPDGVQSNSVAILTGETLQPVTDEPWFFWEGSYTLDDGSITTENIVFSNLRSGYDATGSFRTYHVSYTDSAGVQRVVLLNNTPLFQVADVSLYDEIAPHRRFYTISLTSKGYLVESLFNAWRYSPTSSLISPAALLSYQTQSGAYGAIFPPVFGDTEEPWFVRVSNAEFYRSGNDNNSHFYTLKKFYDQTFSPCIPYKSCQFLKSEIISSRMIKLPYDSIVIDPDNNFHFELAVYRKGEAFLAYSTDSTKTVYLDDYGVPTDILYQSSSTLQFDNLNGIVQLDRSINLDDVVYTTFIRKEQCYEYVSLNFNPLFNQAIVNQDVWLMLAPTHASLRFVNIANSNQGQLANLKTVLDFDLTSSAIDAYVIKKNVSVITESYWYTGDILFYDMPDADELDDLIESVKGGRVVFTNHSNVATIMADNNLSYSGTFQKNNFTFKYINLGAGYLVDASLPDEDSLSLGFASLIEDSQRSLSATLTDLVAFLSPNIDTIWGNSKSLIFLIFDQSGKVIQCDHEFLPLAGHTYDHIETWYSITTDNRMQCVLLGNIVINPNLSIYGLDSIDVRVPGGGVRPGLCDSLIKNYPQIASCFDHARWNGHPYPGAVAIYIEIPYTVLSTYGGHLSHAKVAELIRPYIAAGTYPVIRFYGSDDPTILSHVATSNSVALTWEDNGGPYTVAWGLAPDALNESIIVADPAYTISGLLSATTYYISVTATPENSRLPEQTPFSLITQ
jgi:hypothetical protein